MKQLFQVSLIYLSLVVFSISYSVKNAQAQTEITSNIEISNTNIDDLPNDPQQMFSWQCVNDNKEIAIEVKDVDNWQQMLENQNWSCQENLSILPTESGKISCTPPEGIGILSISWLQGEGAKEQMQTWFNYLSNSENMTCYQAQTNNVGD